MDERGYYSARQSVDRGRAKLDLNGILFLFHETYEQMSKDGYFQEFLGFRCTDWCSDSEGAYNPGKLGSEAMTAAHMSLKLNKGLLWPIEELCGNYSEDDLFDVIVE